MKNFLYSSKVIKGIGLAKTLGYPTVNLENPQILKKRKKGVYLCRAKFNKNYYFGLLYFGPRLIFEEIKDILEIFIFDFNKEIYGKKIMFRLLKYIRGILDFEDTEKLKEQIAIDFETASNLIK